MCAFKLVKHFLKLLLIVYTFVSNGELTSKCGSGICEIIGMVKSWVLKVVYLPCCLHRQYEVLYH